MIRQVKRNVYVDQNIIMCYIRIKRVNIHENREVPRYH